MRDEKPNWNIWLRMPSISVAEAIALTFNRNPPALQSDWSKPREFKDRLMLCRAIHGGKVAPAMLSEWAQSVGWNIPKALAALAPRPDIQYQPADADFVKNALAEIAVPGGGAALYVALLNFGVRFIVRGESLDMNSPDDTVNGRTEHASHGAVASLWWGQEQGKALGRLIQGTGASGGGAQSSTSSTHPVPTPAVIERTAAPKCAEPLPAVLPAINQPAPTLAANRKQRRDALPEDDSEKRAALLVEFRKRDGKRPGEPGKGQRGALVSLSREVGMHSKNLGAMLDEEIEENRRRSLWSQGTNR